MLLPFASAGAKGAGTGDVTGPSSATDGDIVVFDGATGKAVKDGSVTVATLKALAAERTWFLL